MFKAKMANESSLRIRLTFEDESILTETQQTNGMNNSWILIEPNQHSKISDICNHLLHNFNLHTSCPNGILLFMEGFVLPPSESTRLLKDKDIICVKRKVLALAEATDGENACNLLEEGEVNRNDPPADNGMLLLANEEFDKETGGYKSELKDIKGEMLEDEPSPKEKASKKRKASTKILSSKTKKHRLAVMDGVEDEVVIGDDDINNDESVPKKKITKKIIKKVKKNGESETNMEKLKSPSKVNEGEVDVGDDNISKDESVPKKKIIKKITQKKVKSGESEANTEKVKSPTKVKRLKKDEDKTMIVKADNDNNGESIPKKTISKKKVKPNAETNKPIAETSDKNIEDDVEGVEPISTALDGVKKVPSRSARRKKAKRQWKREQAKILQNSDTNLKPEVAENKEAPNGQSEELSSEDEVPAEIVHKHVMKQEERNCNGNGDTKLVPCVVRPGHIRFEPLDKDEDAKQIPDVAFQWNGITSKKKGQKWGLENFSTSRRDDFQNETEEPSTMLTADAQVTMVDAIDFDQLPLCTSPKEGDVIAYRVLELTSAWTPEMSSFRVGKISHYDGDDIVLMPVPEYPIVLDKSDEDGQNIFYYGEDGRLEIKYAGLSDVRIVKQSKSNAIKAVGNGVNQSSKGDDKKAAIVKMSSSNDNKENVSKDPSPVVATKEVNTWDELKESLNAKKSELMEIDEEIKKDSGKNKWSYRALRGSALGPTMAMLRSTNNI